MTAALDDVGQVYDRTAPYYDQLTAHDDYGMWTAAVDDLIRSASPPGRRLLDVGCGAGRSSAHLAGHGYAVTGIDASAAMIEQARRRSDAVGIGFHVHDARVPWPGEPVDVVNCMSDVVNYQLDSPDLHALLHTCAGALRPGGVLVFDVNTEANYRRAADADAVLETGDGLLVWRTRPDQAAPDRWRLTLDTFTPRADGTWDRTTVVHRQTRHRLADLEAGLRAAGLEMVAVRSLDQRGRISTTGCTDATPATKLLCAARRTVTVGDPV